MGPSQPKHAQIGTLILATSCIQLASGFFGTFISLRVALEGFDATMAGLVLSSVYAGLAVGAVRSGRIIERIGHIRAYAVFASLIVAATAAMTFWVGSLLWLFLRAIIGFGFAGLFVTTESWLNAKARSAERGRVFALYMVGTFIALAIGQLLIGRIAIETSVPFTTIVTLCAVALVMVSTTRAEPPVARIMPTLPYGQLTRIAPVAVVGAALSGLITSSFYTLVPLWMNGRGIDQKTIGLFMLMAVLGGLAFQVPVGRLSDRFDRRAVLATLCVGCWVCFHRDRLDPSSTLIADHSSRRRNTGRIHVYPVPCLCGPRARPYVGRSSHRRDWPAHPGERVRLGGRTADRPDVDDSLWD